MITKFLVVGNVRCGATWLQSILAGSEGIVCDEELRWMSRSDEECFRVKMDKGTFALSEYLKGTYSKGSIVGSKMLLDPQVYSDEDYSNLKNIIDPSILLIHVHRNYRDILKSIIQNQGHVIERDEKRKLPPILQKIRDSRDNSRSEEIKLSSRQCTDVLGALYKNDQFFTKLQLHAHKYFQVEYEDIPARLPDILEFMGSEVHTPTFVESLSNCALKKNPEKKLPNVVKYSRIKTAVNYYENLRGGLKNISYLSKCGQNALLSSDSESREKYLYDGALDESHLPIMVFVDIVPGKEYLVQFFQRQRVQKNSILIIFSFPDLVRDFLAISECQEAIKEGLIKIWYVDEWKSLLEKEFENPRSPLNLCKTVVTSDKKSALAREVSAVVFQGVIDYLQIFSKGRESIKEYYKGDVFQNRLKSIAQGELPRVYLERACDSVAVKRYTDGCAESFKSLGCEVFVHDPCHGGSIDLEYASIIDVDRYKPDLFIRSPNTLKYDGEIDFGKDLPTIYSIQDLTPHFECVELLTRTPINRHDIIFFWVEEFIQQYCNAGAKPSQLLCDHIPTTNAVIDLKGIAEEKSIDIGFVKTMDKDKHLRDFPGFDEEKEKPVADFFENKIFYTVRGQGAIAVEEVLSWGKKRVQQESLLSFYHTQLSYYYIDLLHHEKYTLGVTGKNWEGFSHLKQHCLGHAETREEYQSRFLKNKINLSINPWSEHHPRILEGGMCEAFFLVFHVPEELAWCKMAKEFIPGEHFDYFSSPSELLEKCQFYLERPELREEIGRNLKKLVQERFSYERLCTEFIRKFRSSLQSED
ncbi:MAG: hypothetical protein ACI9S8_000018 [Chlamydiales bacterium]